MHLTNLLRPYYLQRPSQILRRIANGVFPRHGLKVVRLPWGTDIEVDTADEIGGALWRNGVYDLAVSEMLWRLTPPRGFAVDVGANIGCITSLLAARVGPQGRVIAAEPHPEIRRQLLRNVALFGNARPVARVEVIAAAITDSESEATLVVDERFATNRGTARIVDGAAADGRAVVVPTMRLDALVPEDRQVDMLKVDVEGHEAAVFRGATGLLEQRAVRHIVYEDHEKAGSPVHTQLAGFGYEIFSLGWNNHGPVLGPVDAPISRDDEAPSYLATVAPDQVVAAAAEPGWRMFSA